MGIETLDAIEFGRRREEIRRVLWNALILYLVWKELRYFDDEDELTGINRFRGFFSPVRFALFQAMVVEFAKLFDSDPRANSLDRLIRGAVQAPTLLVPRLSQSKVQNVARRLRPHRPTIKNLMRARQKAAHSDAAKDQGQIEGTTGLTLAALEDMAADLTEVFNELSSAHDGQVWSFDYQSERSAWETTEIRRIMREEMDRAQRRIEQFQDC